MRRPPASGSDAPSAGDAESGVEPPGRVSVVGTGQIGTAIGLALMGSGPAAPADLRLFDADPSVLGRSLGLGAGHRAAPDLQAALDADVLVLAIPVPDVVALLEDHGSSLRPGSLVLDTGSTKAPVVRAMARWVPPAVHAVGGHPMAGTAVPGPEGASPELLARATFVLCPAREDPRGLAAAASFASALGARPLAMDAAAHDAAVARTSHLPHLLAFALAEVVGRGATEGLPVDALRAGGYASATRLAGSDPDMAAGFLATNAEEVRRAADAFVRTLEDLLTAAGHGAPRLAERLGRARRAALSP